MPDLVHGTAIALAGRAALIRGPSGCGKSDLALRCLSIAPSALLPAAAVLVADDQAILEAVGERLFVISPAPIRGLIEVRGLGVVPVPHLDRAEVALVVDLVSPEEVERLPDPDLQCTIAGIRIRLLRLAPFAASAPIKLLLALSAPQA